MMVEAYFDGACEPFNPGGTAAFGAVVFKDGQRIFERSEIFRPPPGKEAETSNNVAEYLGLIAALDYLRQQGMTGEYITIKGDSMLVIKQMQGQWRIKKGFYVPLAIDAKHMLSNFPNVRFEWIPREQNELADELSKRELKTNGIGSR